MEEMEIRRLMAESGFYPDIRVLEEVDSTNTYLSRLAASGAAEGTVAIAARQTAGKGRHGRQFCSPSGGGLYLSVLLRPEVPAGVAALLTGCAAVAAYQAVEDVCPLAPDIKWVNDLLLNGRKICGILAESVLSQGQAHVVLGIGINANSVPEGLPPEIRRTATTLSHETGEMVPLPRLAAALLDRLAGFYRGFPGNVPRYVEEYRARLRGIGQYVAIVGDAAREPLRVLDIDGRFGLIVEAPGGEQRILRSGEVSVRKTGDSA